MSDAPLPELSREGSKVPFLLSRFASLGAIAQSAIPALYAWGLTVAPAAFMRGAGVPPKVSSILALVAIGVAIVLEQTRPALARPVFMWGFVGSSVLTWALAPQGISPAKLDAVRGFLGALGWLMFAFSAAAPPLRQAAAGGRLIEGKRLEPRGRVARGDALYLGGAFVFAIGLQAIGWSTTSPERGLLVRAVTLVSGVAIINAATEVATFRHQKRKTARARARASRMWPSVTLLVMLILAGFAYLLLRT